LGGIVIGLPLRLAATPSVLGLDTVGYAGIDWP
jgi:hypothetical protein